MSPDKPKLKKWTAAKIEDFLAVTGEADVRGEGARVLTSICKQNCRARSPVHLFNCAKIICTSMY